MGAPNSYKKHNTVRWSYGNYADWFYRIDIRFRLNRSFDSLRKFPLFIMSENINLNQGFHDLIIDGERRSSVDMGRDDLLVVRHYKLFNEQESSMLCDIRPTAAYHHDTKKNLERLRENLQENLLHAAMSPFTRC